MSWTALTYGLVIFLGFWGLLFMWFWPRGTDGRFMSLEEVEKLLKKYPQPPSNRPQQIILILFTTIAVICVALTKHGKSFHNHHDD